MFEKLVKVLETEPSKATQIGTYTVCLDADFVVGRGSDGTTVYIGLCDDGSEVAVKTLLIDRCKELGPNEKEILNTWYVRKEHHIVNYRYYTEKVDSRLAYLVLDLCEESLKEYVLSKERTKDTLKTDGPKLMREILYGLKALHCGKPAILHRDLKPSNIFMNVQGEVVLADFGISRKLGEGQTTHKSSERGAEGWIAVESLPREDEQDSPSDVEISVRYKKSSDVQVAGMVFFYILTKGVHPYGKRIYQNINLMEDKPVNLYMLDDFMAKDLINWMLRHSPNDRPSVEECLKHPYLISADDRFRFLTRVGNEPEIKSKDTSSPVVQQLNDDPSLPKPSWSVKIDADVMAYISGKRSYTDDVADLLRFIRNTSEHWNDKPPPAIVANLVGTPKDYFLKLFPSLPVVLHRIIRKSPDWSQRDELKQFF